MASERIKLRCLRLKPCQKTFSGIALGHTQTPITPVMVGDAHRAKLLSAQLFDAGVFVQAIAFPTVPRDTARLRVMLSAAHTREDLEFALEILARLGQACEII
jgi:glycine C-acetyltransferase